MGAEGAALTVIVVVTVQAVESSVVFTVYVPAAKPVLVEALTLEFDQE